MQQIKLITALLTLLLLIGCGGSKSMSSPGVYSGSSQETGTENKTEADSADSSEVENSNTDGPRRYAAIEDETQREIRDDIDTETPTRRDK
ncbi:MAG: hypothetical protein P1R58_09350, partial [bacterium]|nr:hypothetical protein [bacterium]